MLRFRALFFPLRFSRSSFPHPTPCFGRCAPVLAFRPASASHFDPRTPARTPVLHSGPVFREGRLLRFEPALRSSHPVLALLSPYSCLRTPASALLPPHPGPHSGPVFRAAYPGPVLRPRPAPHILPRALGGGFWRRLLPPGPLPHFVPRSRPRAPAPAFPPRISGGGFEGRFSGDILERRIPGGGFEGGFSGNILERRIPGGGFEGGGVRSGSCVRPPRRVSELRILANRQNKVYL